jgi:DNA-binding transcriptional ArsR family regulator
MSSDAHFGGDDAADRLATVPTECYEALRHPRRLRILEVLGRRTARLSLAELTTALVEGDVPDGRTREDVRIALVHDHLPRLVDHGIVDRTDDGVALADDPPVDPDDLSRLLDLCADEDAAALLETVVDPVRLRLLAALGGTDRPLSIDRLASRLGEDGSFDDAERARLALHHSHLPALADVGVLDYDRESGLVARSGSAALVERTH